MNNLDKTYTTLLQDILDNGVEKKDRTGTGTISVFGRQIRHKMSDGFPLLTCKKMYMKGIVTELLWFLRGDTNIKFLINNNCHIWDGDAYKNYLKHFDELDPMESLYSGSIMIGASKPFIPFTQEEFINKIKTDDEFAKKWGELGPVYGKQWRDWEYYCGGGDCNIDQIANLINDLKTNPDSRRLMVNAWNVGELDQMVLPPCHYGFQVYTRELTARERCDAYLKWSNDSKCIEWKNHIENEMGWDYKKPEWVFNEVKEQLDKAQFPTRAISLMWNQRSVDTFLGLPFNIASYGLLLEIIAKEVNMVPDELIGNLGDTHLYLNHIEQAKEQIGRELTLEERIERMYQINEKDSEHLFTETDPSHHLFDNLNVPKRTREPFELPTLKINGTEPSIIEKPKYWKPDDFIIENYQSHPKIVAPISN
jgi:thymidylate synthase